MRAKIASNVATSRYTSGKLRTQQLSKNPERAIEPLSLRVFCMASDYKMQDKIIARLVTANDRLEFAMVLHLCVFDSKDVQENYKATLKTAPGYLALNSIHTGKPIRGRNSEHALAREMAQLMLNSPEALAALPEHFELVQNQTLQRALYALWIDDVLTHQQSAQQLPHRAIKLLGN